LVGFWRDCALPGACVGLCGKCAVSLARDSEVSCCFRSGERTVGLSCSEFVFVIKGYQIGPLCVHEGKFYERNSAFTCFWGFQALAYRVRKITTVTNVDIIIACRVLRQRLEMTILLYLLFKKNIYIYIIIVCFLKYFLFVNILK
jgi:hypothetical protein